MPGVATPAKTFQVPGMGKPKHDSGKAGAGKQVNFRAPDDLAVRLEDVAEGLGLDLSNLVRMVLYENLAAYEERAAQARANRERKGGR